MLSEEEKAEGAETTAENSRFNCLNAFLYYCDFRAKIRKTPGNILIKNCGFKNVDAVFSHPFGEATWTCNRALDNITFEDCVFDGLKDSISICSSEDEPVSFKMKGCTLSAKENHTFMAAHNFRKIELSDVHVSGYENSEIVCSTDGEVVLDKTPNVTVRSGAKCTRGPQ